MVVAEAATNETAGAETAKESDEEVVTLASEAEPAGEETEPMKPQALTAGETNDKNETVYEKKEELLTLSRPAAAAAKGTEERNCSNNSPGNAASVISSGT